jgi:hypothetical protein
VFARIWPPYAAATPSAWLGLRTNSVPSAFPRD